MKNWSISDALFSNISNDFKCARISQIHLFKVKESKMYLPEILANNDGRKFPDMRLDGGVGGTANLLDLRRTEPRFFAFFSWCDGAIPVSEYELLKFFLCTSTALRFTWSTSQWYWYPCWENRPCGDLRGPGDQAPCSRRNVSLTFLQTKQTLRNETQYKFRGLTSFTWKKLIHLSSISPPCGDLSNVMSVMSTTSDPVWPEQQHQQTHPRHQRSGARSSLLSGVHQRLREPQPLGAHHPAGGSLSWHLEAHGY